MKNSERERELVLMGDFSDFDVNGALWIDEWPRKYPSVFNAEK